MASGFRGELTRAGVAVPSDVSVVSFDGIDWAAHLPTPLTTIHQPKRELGRRAARFLVDRIAGRSIPDMTVLEPELAVRDSTARAAR